MTMNKIYVEFSIEEWEILRGIVRELEDVCSSMIENVKDEKLKVNLIKRQNQIIETSAHLSVQDLVNMGVLERDDHPATIARKKYFSDEENKDEK